MIQLFITLNIVEMGVIMSLMFGIAPLRKVVMMGLKRVKQGRGPVMATSVAGTLFAVLISTLISVTKIQKRSYDNGGTTNPTDQLLLANHLLEACLMGIYF